MPGTPHLLKYFRELLSAYDPEFHLHFSILELVILASLARRSKTPIVFRSFDDPFIGESWWDFFADVGYRQARALPCSERIARS